jgi:hypothetical protein
VSSLLAQTVGFGLTELKHGPFPQQLRAESKRTTPPTTYARSPSGVTDAPRPTLTSPGVVGLEMLFTQFRSIAFLASAARSRHKNVAWRSWNDQS